MRDHPQRPGAARTALPAPATRRHGLGAQLRALRQARSLRLEDVATTLGITPGTLSRIETGKAPTRTSYLTILLDLYGIDDPAERARMAGLARDGQRRPWWAGCADLLPAGAGTCLDLEANAEHIRCYAARAIPGMLQTRDYAQAAHLAVRPGLTTDEARKLAAQQQHRREHLAGGHRLQLVIDQVALLTPVADADIMACQLHSLLASAAAPGVTIQVIPLAMPAPVLSPPFSVLTFSEPGTPAVTCCHGPGGQILLSRRAADARAAVTTFSALTRTALPPGDSAELITELARRTETGNLPALVPARPADALVS